MLLKMHPVYELRHHPILSHDLNIKRKPKRKKVPKDRPDSETHHGVNVKQKKLKEIDKQQRKMRSIEKKGEKKRKKKKKNKKSEQRCMMQIIDE